MAARQPQPQRFLCSSPPNLSHNPLCSPLTLAGDRRRGGFIMSRVMASHRARTRRIALLPCAIAGVVIANAMAIIAQESTLRFEVASVKPNVSSDGSFSFRPDPADGFFRTNYPLFDGVIRYAYELQPFRVIGAPEWTRTDRFDIAAKASRAISDAERRLMVRALLADRFRMKSHFEMREH